ncbi:hypothetical protein CCP3SC5AM1_20020 [Gammaproteobacteria bacterium]
MQLPLSELRTEESFVGESCTSLQRSPMFWTQAGKSSFILLKPSAFSRGVIYRYAHGWLAGRMAGVVA